MRLGLLDLTADIDRHGVVSVHDGDSRVGIAFRTHLGVKLGPRLLRFIDAIGIDPGDVAAACEARLPEPPTEAEMVEQWDDPIHTAVEAVEHLQRVEARINRRTSARPQGPDSPSYGSIRVPKAAS